MEQDIFGCIDLLNSLSGAAASGLAIPSIWSRLNSQKGVITRMDSVPQRDRGLDGGRAQQDLPVPLKAQAYGAEKTALIETKPAPSGKLSGRGVAHPVVEAVYGDTAILIVKRGEDLRQHA